MITESYRFEFEPVVPIIDAEMSLHLAMIALEGLHGQAQVRLEAAYHVDESSRTITVNGTTDVGADLVRVFTGLLIREFGEDAFEVRSMPCAATPEEAAVAAA
jgi:hypothetical protein